LAFARYCHYQHCMACIATKDGRGERLYCAIVWAMKGASGVPKRRECLRIMVSILVQRPRTKRISCKGQRGGCLATQQCASELVGSGEWLGRRRARARARARGKTRNRWHGKREHDTHPQGTHTEGRTPQRTHHRRGGPHRGPTQNTHRQEVPCLIGPESRRFRVPVLDSAKHGRRYRDPAGISAAPLR